jgi:hypothetical protein
LICHPSLLCALQRRVNREFTDDRLRVDGI